MVLVDVVATDSYGNPAHDLKAGDFTVLDNGKPQSIAAFDELRPDGKPRPAAPLNLPDNVYTNYVSRREPGALTVLLFDSLNADRQDLPNARQKMLNFLKKPFTASRRAVPRTNSTLWGKLLSSMVSATFVFLDSALSFGAFGGVAITNSLPSE